MHTKLRAILPYGLLNKQRKYLLYLVVVIFLQLEKEARRKAKTASASPNQCLYKHLNMHANKQPKHILFSKSGSKHPCAES